MNAGDPVSVNAHRLPTAWMWAVDAEVFGLSIDLETHTLRWFANAGCLCDWDDAETDQSIAQYRARGTPGRIGEPPPDVQAEIGRTLAALAPGAPQ